MLERSLEIAEVLRGEGGDDEDRKPVCMLSMKMSFKTVVCVSVNLFLLFVQLVETTLYRGSDGLGLKIAQYKSTSVTDFNGTAQEVCLCQLSRI